MSDDERRRLHAVGAAAIDSIANRVDDMAAMLDGRDVVVATGALGAALVDLGTDRETLAQVVAVMALRHRRAMAAATEISRQQARSAFDPAEVARVRRHWLAWGAAVGALTGAVLGALVYAGPGALAAAGGTPYAGALACAGILLLAVGGWLTNRQGR